MIYTVKQTQPPTPNSAGNNLTDRIGKSLHEHFWDGFVSEYFIIFGSNIREQDPGGLVYKKHAEININGRFLKILPPPEETDLTFTIGLGEEQQLMKMIFVEPGSPIPAAQYDQKKDFVTLFYPLSILTMYLGALENSKNMSIGVFPFTPGKSFLRIQGILDIPKTSIDEPQHKKAKLS